MYLFRTEASAGGGGLAVAVALMARDKKSVNIAFQMPFYPMLDDRMITPSSKENDAPVWNTRANEAAWRLYLGALAGTDHVPVYAAPARETDYTGLPPAYTFVGDIDPFHDEVQHYIDHLKKAGIQAELDVYRGCFHGFDMLCRNSGIVRLAKGRYMERFKYAVKNYYREQ